MSAVSNCEGSCSHFYICKYREEYQKHNNKKLEVENLPDFIVSVPFEYVVTVLNTIPAELS